jgi:adenosylcobinamide-phosphate synthase
MIFIFIAYILRVVFGEIAWLPDPAKGIRWLASGTENFFKMRLGNQKFAGMALVVFVILCVYMAAKFLIWDAALLHPALIVLVETILIYLALSMKGPQKEHLSHNNVESVAQNTVDGVISVLLYAFIGGSVLVWVYKSINILYLRLGHKNVYYGQTGWFCAKLNDIFNYIPSRLAILIIPAASYLLHSGFMPSFRMSYKEGLRHPAPNSGIPQAAFAGALKVQLGGLNYSEGLPVHMPYVGHAYNAAGPGHIKEAVKLMYASSAVMMALLIIVNYIWNVL